MKSIVEIVNCTGWEESR